jgi:hypothetical protein
VRYLGLVLSLAVVGCGSSAPPSRSAWCPAFHAFSSAAPAVSPSPYAARALAGKWGAGILGSCPGVVAVGVGSPPGSTKAKATGPTLFVGLKSKRDLPRDPVFLNGVPVGFQVMPSLPHAPTTGTRPRSVPKGHWTNPYVTPRVGGRQTVFTLSLTVRDPLGHQGPLWRYYEITIAPCAPHGACRVEGDMWVAGGREGQAVRVALVPHGSGWPSGTYRVGVAWDGEEYCMWKRQQCGNGYSILPFPSGDASFTVR